MTLAKTNIQLLNQEFKNKNIICVSTGETLMDSSTKWKCLICNIEFNKCINDFRDLDAKCKNCYLINLSIIRTKEVYDRIARLGGTIIGNYIYERHDTKIYSLCERSHEHTTDYNMLIKGHWCYKCAHIYTEAWEKKKQIASSNGFLIKEEYTEQNAIYTLVCKICSTEYPKTGYLINENNLKCQLCKDLKIKKSALDRGYEIISQSRSDTGKLYFTVKCPGGIIHENIRSDCHLADNNFTWECQQYKNWLKINEIAIARGYTFLLEEKHCGATDQLNFRCSNKLCPDFSTQGNNFCNGCGCPNCNAKRRSLTQKRIQVILAAITNSEWYGDYKTTLELKKGHYHRADCYSKDYDIYVEYDGEHHFRNIYGDADRFARVLEIDVLVNKAFERKLIRISYTEVQLSTKDEVVRSLLLHRLQSINPNIKDSGDIIDQKEIYELYDDNDEFIVKAKRLASDKGLRLSLPVLSRDINLTYMEFTCNKRNHKFSATMNQLCRPNGAKCKECRLLDQIEKASDI